MYFHPLTTAAVLAAWTIGSVGAIAKISVKGSKFFTDDGNQFYIKGRISLWACLAAVDGHARGCVSIDV